MCSQSQVKEAEQENSKLQLQVKELNEEYRARLVCYLRDIAVSRSTHTCLTVRYLKQNIHPCCNLSLHVLHSGVH